MNRRSIGGAVFAVGLLLLGACSACPPSAPTAVTVVVEPNRVPIFAGAEQEFAGQRRPGKFSVGHRADHRRQRDQSRGHSRRDSRLSDGRPDSRHVSACSASTRGGTGFADFQVVTRANQLQQRRGVPSDAGNVAVPGCRATFMTSYITAEDGLQMRAVLLDAANTESAGFCRPSAPLAAAGQLQLQGGTANRTTEAVEIVFSKARAGDVFRQRYPAHYVWPSC